MPDTQASQCNHSRFFKTAPVAERGASRCTSPMGSLVVLRWVLKPTWELLPLLGLLSLGLTGSG